MIGYKITGKELVKTVGFSAVVIGFFYAVVFFIFWLFKTDFHFLRMSIQTFEAGKLWTAVWYVPFFFAYYFLDALLINGALRIKGMSEKKNLWLATIVNAGGMVLFIIVQYIGVFLNGSMTGSHYTIQGDWGFTLYILMCVWQLAVAPNILRKSYNMTGKSWAGPITLSVLFTIIDVANTVISCWWF